MRCAILDDARDDVRRAARRRARLPHLARSLAGRGTRAAAVRRQPVQVGLPGPTPYTSMARSPPSSARATTPGSTRPLPTLVSRPTSRRGGRTRPTAQTLLNRALCLMWTEVRWRPPAARRSAGSSTRSIGCYPGRTRTTRCSPTPGGRGRSCRAARHRRPDVPPGPRPRRARRRGWRHRSATVARRSPSVMRAGRSSPGSFAERRTRRGVVGRRASDGASRWRRSRRRRPAARWAPRRCRPVRRRPGRMRWTIARAAWSAGHGCRRRQLRRRGRRPRRLFGGVGSGPRSGSSSTIRATGNGRSTCGGHSRPVELVMTRVRRSPRSDAPGSAARQYPQESGRDRQYDHGVGVHARRQADEQDAGALSSNPAWCPRTAASTKRTTWIAP